MHSHNIHKSSYRFYVLSWKQIFTNCFPLYCSQKLAGHQKRQSILDESIPGFVHRRMMPVYVGGNYGQFELISNAVSNALFIRFTDWPNLLIPSWAKGQFPYPICHIPVTVYGLIWRKFSARFRVIQNKSNRWAILVLLCVWQFSICFRSLGK